MQQNAATALTFDQLRDAVQGNIAAIRSISTLIPAGGAGDKVFPPTYEGGKYATEKRRIENQEVETVLLDSVQSQANRMELALLAAYNRGEIAFPLLAVDFSKQFPDIGEITALEAPHRIADAIFRDSLLGGNEFRKSEAGKRFSNANLKNATALLELCPTALIFGIWDSTNLDLRQGLRLERAIVSEIVGCKFIRGVKAESRIDPLAIEKAVTIYETADGSWTADENSAKKDQNNKATLFRRNRKTGEPGRPSLINHGNVTPTVNDDTGGGTISHAVQTAVLSLIAIRRLRFPLNDQSANPESNFAAHTLLAALALTGVACLRDEGYDLRSRCLLVPNNPPIYEMVPADGSAPVSFSLSARNAKDIFAQSVEEVRKCGLPWTESKIVLQPAPKLIQLIQKSRDAQNSAQPE